MKQKISICAMVLAFQFQMFKIHAQPLTDVRERAGYQLAEWNGFLLPQNKFEPGPPTAQGSRLIATYHRTFDSASFRRSSDSIRFYWSGHATIKAADVAGINFINQLQLKPDYTKAALLGTDSVHDNSKESVPPLNQLRFRTTNVFRADGKIAAEVTQAFSSFTGIWENYAKYDYQYNQSGKVIEQILSIAETNGSWKNNKRSSFDYDQQGNLTVFEKNLWNDLTNTWKRDRKATSTYDAENNWLTEVRQEWNDTLNDWKNQQKHQFEYNNDGRRISQIIQLYNDQNGTWELSERTLYSYNTNGEREFDTSAIWIQEIPGWFDVGCTKYSFDSQDRYAKFVERIHLDNAWHNNRKFEYVYSSESADVENIILSFWNLADSTWILDSRLNLVHNEFHQLSEIDRTMWSGTTWMHSEGERQYRFFYEQYDQGTGIDGIANKAIPPKIYPNPATEMLTVENGSNILESIIIYDVLGKIAFRSQGKVSAQIVNIPVRHLNAGNYFLHLTTANGTTLKKVAVRH